MPKGIQEIYDKKRMSLIRKIKAKPEIFSVLMSFVLQFFEKLFSKDTSKLYRRMLSSVIFKPKEEKSIQPGKEIFQILSRVENLPEKTLEALGIIFDAKVPSKISKIFKEQQDTAKQILTFVIIAANFADLQLNSIKEFQENHKKVLSALAKAFSCKIVVISGKNMPKKYEGDFNIFNNPLYLLKGANYSIIYPNRLAKEVIESIFSFYYINLNR